MPYLMLMGSLRPVVGPSACFEGRTRVHDALEVAGYLPGGLGGIRLTSRRIEGREVWNTRRSEQGQQLVVGVGRRC